MITFLVRTRSVLPPTQVLERLFDLEAHTVVIPFTRVHHDRTGLRAGARFTARTGIAAVGFDDRMRVEVWEPPTQQGPARVVITKLGPWLFGRIEVLIRADASGTGIEWRQELTVRGLPRALEPVVAVALTRAYAAVIRQLLGTRAGADAGHTDVQ